MDFGAAMFFTDYSMSPAELGRALEERGFESVWAPEHSHIPSSRATPFPQGGELPKKYYDAMDPFVTLTAAAVATKTLKIGTGVCLVAQRDPIQTAKADRLDRSDLARAVSVRCRRRLERRGDGGSRHSVQDALQADARTGRGDEGDLDRGRARISWRTRRLSEDANLTEAGAKAAPAGHRRRRLPFPLLRERRE
jgi:Luciferase-like monooxygenase